MITGYARVSMTGNPVSSTQYQFDLFEDRNNNYSFDSDDYPENVDVDTINVSNIYAPSSISFGLNAALNNDINIFGEFQLWNDQAINDNFSSIYTDQIAAKTGRSTTHLT